MLEFDDIQAYILSGYSHKPYSCFFFYEIIDAALARHSIRDLLPHITYARRREPSESIPTTATNVAFTVGGLRTLGLDDAAIASFPREFNGGDDYTGAANPMAMPASSAVLEDVGQSAPEHWQFGGPNTPPVHVLLMLFASDKALLDDFIKKMGAHAKHGLRLVYHQHSNREGEREAFGFSDGISQPAIEGSYMPVKPGQQVVKAGEFILGYTNEYAMNPPTPVVAVANDPENLLPVLSPGQKDLGRNGTYLAVRKLRQHVHDFWKFCTDKTRDPDGSENPAKKELLAAKMFGRWKSGAPLALAPDRDDPALGADDKRNNNFLYADDPGGLKCPMGSHLRRSNPRDNLPPDDPKTSLTVSGRHRIIRRGRPYNNPNGNEGGLMFMAVNADIQRQFEFVLQTWINSPKFGHLYDNKDPIVSEPKLLDPVSGGTQESVMVIPGEQVRQRVSGLQRFIDVRGGGYFFMPGLRALRYLGSDPGKVDTATGKSSASTQVQSIPSAANPDQPPMSFLKSLWQDVVSAKETLHDEFLNLRELLSVRVEHMMAEPQLVRPLFAFLRKHDPIFVAKNLAVVTKYDDVVEVMGNEACFSVADIYAKKMVETTGIFVLGMDDTETYRREMGWMRQAVRHEDIERLRLRALEITREQIALASASRQIDVVGALGLLIPTRIVGEYFGAPGPDDATTQRWMQAIFREIFLDLGNDPTFHQQAVTAGAELRASLLGIIATRRQARDAGQTLPDDFLSRLVMLQASDAALTDETISRLVGGTIVGTVPTNNKAIVQSLDVLLDRPDSLALMRDAAAKGDFDLVTRYVFEALRFNPQNPLLMRHCVKDCTVAAGTPRAKEIKAGSLVIVGTESAMFDDDKFPQPDEFLVNRPLDSYIHFGSGMHTCFGKHIGTMLWPTVLAPLVQLGHLARAQGSDGKIAFDGVFPTRWILTFDPR
jgi:Dyp-type peroxidase family